MLSGSTIAKAEIVGGGKFSWKQEDDALVLNLPAAKPGQMVPVIRLRGEGLVSRAWVQVFRMI
ncbi:hypothetical protein J3E64_000939 [Sphingobium sp. OAS761]|uniref:hypothetical protein n=1 Tax=Sphingobium sp. OAS761 TaxID=2817901 RepID=UPI0020A18FFF|nr:hypothetical protein [Sphingobium sp. OAS761]MCP1469264.1 hypothetical protein [Sphingobium sp. OAS761]